MTTEEKKFIVSKTLEGWSTERINEHTCIACSIINELKEKLQV